MASCASSAPSGKLGLDLPRIPPHIKAGAGRVTPLPKGGLDGHSAMRLMAQVRRNELRQARLAAQGVSYYESVRRKAARK